jgi:murein DD-endopeptidase MepM/ murein hydrolase activator NlpD
MVRCWWDARGGGRVASWSSRKLRKGFDYLHLSQCRAGKHTKGSIIGRTGDTGVGAAHFHLQQRNDQGNLEPPEKHYVELALKGVPPTYIKPTTGILTSGYGYRVCKNSPEMTGEHLGVDWANAVGTPIVAAAGGEVIFAGWDADGLGNMVAIRHHNGSITRYGHNHKLLVSKGQWVKQRQTITEMGSTGNSTGSHLHFELELKDRRLVDPLKYLPKTLEKGQFLC